jgi:glycosyltransferase involved in cell wall biosynthesis
MPDQEKRLISFILPSLVGGGVERVIVNLSNQFARNGYPVDIVMLSGSRDSPYSEEIDGSINVISLRGPQKQYNLLLKGIVALFFIRKVVRYIDNARPGVIFASTCEHMAVLANVLSKNRGKIAVIIHSNPSFETSLIMHRGQVLRLRFFRLLSNLLFPRVDRVIGVSKAIAGVMSEDYPFLKGKTCFIYNPAITKTLREKSKEPPAHRWLVKKERPVFLGVGRLSEEKNFALLLRAFKLVSSKLDARLIILGEGPLLNELKQLSEDLGVEADVDFAGFLKNPFSVMSNSDVFVLSSNVEGFGMVLTEAMACGCQLVSTNCPSGPSEILDDGKYGRLVPTNDESALAEAMIDALSNPMDKDLLMERSKIFEDDRVGREYITLAEELIGRG